MAGEWRDTTLGQVTDFLSGGTPSKDTSQYWSGKIPWVSAKDMKRFHLDDTEDHVTEEGAANGTKLVPSDTVMLLARGMTLLNDVPICVVKRPMTFNQDVKALRPKPGVLNEFLPYLLLGNKDRLLSLVDLAGHGTGRLNSDELKALDVVLPPEPEQRAIAHILSTLDDKIELNRRMNETLEAIARALFKSWFIDFDPVRRNAVRARNQPSPRPSPSGRGHQDYRAGYAFAGLVEAARTLRKKQTPAETIFWELVRDRQFMGLKFRRQHQVGDYIADFYCHEHRLVIELDGGVHSMKRKKDHKRDAWMEAQGFTVLHFSNEQLLNAPESVLLAIADAIERSAEPPSPSGRRAGDEGSVEELDRMFPDSFEDSELGKIPKAWEVGRFGGTVQHLRDQENPLSSPDALFHHFSIPAFDEGQSPKAEYGESIKSLKWRVPTEVVLLSKLNPEIERVWLVDVRPNERSVCSTEFLVLSARPPYTRSFIYCLARSPLIRQQIEGLVTGTSKSHQRAQVDSILNLAVVAPPSSILTAFDHCADDLLARTLKCRRESHTLTALRDALLPKLISGELRVKDAERFMERAV